MYRLLSFAIKSPAWETSELEFWLPYTRDPRSDPLVSLSLKRTDTGDLVPFDLRRVMLCLILAVVSKTIDEKSGSEATTLNMRLELSRRTKEILLCKFFRLKRFHDAVGTRGLASKLNKSI